MDNTVTIALITASAGVAGGLTTGLVGALASDRHDKRKWARELAEKDRERLFLLFEEIVVVQKDLFDRLTAILGTQEVEEPELRELRNAANHFAFLCTRADVLGAVGIESGPVAKLLRDAREDVRADRVNAERFDDYIYRFNQHAGEMRTRMASNLERLRHG